MLSRRQFALQTAAGLAAIALIPPAAARLSMPAQAAAPAPATDIRWIGRTAAHPWSDLASSFITDAKAHGLPVSDAYLRWRLQMRRPTFQVDPAPLTGTAGSSVLDGLAITVSDDGAPITRTTLARRPDGPVVVLVPHLDDDRFDSFAERLTPDTDFIMAMIASARAGS